MSATRFDCPIRKVQLLSIFITPVLVGLVACGPVESQGVASSATTALTIDGNWSQSCHLSSTTSGYTSGNFIAINGTMHSEVYTSLQDSTCATIDLRTSMDAAYVIGDRLNAPANAQAFNTVVSHLAVTALSATMVTTLNASAYCGLTNWQLDVPQDVSSRPCAGTPPALGRTNYGVISETGSSLFFGLKTSANDGSSANRRPTTLNLTDFYSML